MLQSDDVVWYYCFITLYRRGRVALSAESRQNRPRCRVESGVCEITMSIKDDGNDKRSYESIKNEHSVSAIFKLLSHRHRRATIQYLATQVGTTPVADVADQIALLENNHTDDHYARICVTLVHNHLPKLNEAGVVEYDQDQGAVELNDQATDARSYLDLVAYADISG